MPALPEEEVRDRLGALAGWQLEDDAIAREYRFPDFGASVGFVVQLAFRAEAADHHPDLDIRYNRVRVVLSTHSEGGVTEKDLALAAEADGLAGPAVG